MSLSLILANNVCFSYTFFELKKAIIQNFPNIKISLSKIISQITSSDIHTKQVLNYNSTVAVYDGRKPTVLFWAVNMSWLNDLEL